MPAFSLARLKEDLAGGRLTAAHAADYMAIFAEFGTGQLRHLAGNLGLPDPADRAAALANLSACMSGAFPVAAAGPVGGPTTDDAGVTATPAEKAVAKGDPKNAPKDEPKDGPPVAAKAGAKGSDDGEETPDCPGCPKKGGDKAAYESPGSPPAAGPKTSYSSPGSDDGTEKSSLWANEGGASPGKGGKTSYSSPGSDDGTEKSALWEGEGGASPGKGGKCSGGKAGETPADPDAVPAPVAEPTGECPGCKKGDPASMAVDVGGDGDDDGGPLTAEHVLAECAVNGVTDRAAAQTLAAFVVKNPATTHAQIHALYDLVRAFSAGGHMKQPAAVERAVALGSLDGLKRAAASGDEEAAKVLARIPAGFAADYWSGVVLASGRPRTRLAVFAEFVAAGVPTAYTTAYLSDAPDHDPAGSWLSLAGPGGAVRVRIGHNGTVTGGPAGLFGRDAGKALSPAHRPAAIAAMSLAKKTALSVGFEQGRAADGKFGGGGDSTPKGGDEGGLSDLEKQAKEAEKNYTPPKSEKPIDKSGDKSNSLLGRLARAMKGGKAGFAVAPATSGLYAALQNLPPATQARGGALARFAVAAEAATPAGLDPAYYWDELVRGDAGRTTRLALMADRLDAGLSESGAAEAAGRAEFVVQHLAAAAKAVGKAAVGTAKVAGKAAVGTAKVAGKVAGHIDKKLDKIGGGGGHGHDDGGHGKGGGGHDDDGHWMTIAGAAGTTHICVNEEGHITKGPEGLAGRPAHEALNDHHHEQIHIAKQKAKEKREAREKGEHGDHGKGKGASHGEVSHAAHHAGHKVSSAAEHIETAVHFLLHPGAAAAGVAASKVLGSRVGAVKKRIHAIETKIRDRYGAKAGTAIICAGIGGSFAGGMAVPGIGHVLIPMTPGMHLVGALPALAVAETLLQGGKAVKMGGRVLAAGLDKMKKAAGLLKSFLGGRRAAPAESAPEAPKSKKQQKMFEKAMLAKGNKKLAKAGDAAGVPAGKLKAGEFSAFTAAELDALFATSDLYWAAWPGEAALFAGGENDPNDQALDISNEEIQREGKKFWTEFMDWYGKDLRANAGGLKILNDAIEAGRKAGTKLADEPKGKKKKKKGKKPFPPKADAAADDDAGDSAGKPKKGVNPFEKFKKKKADADAGDTGDDATGGGKPEKGVNPFEKFKKKKKKKFGGEKGSDDAAGFSTQWTLFDDVPDLPEAPAATAPVAPTVTPPQTPPAAGSDAHAKAAKLAKKLARHARSGKVGADELKAGLSKLKAFGRGHVETAARCLGLGGPLGGKAGSKSAAIKRITAHLKTHAKAAAAELHAAAGLDPEARPSVVAFDGLPRTRGWVGASLLAAGASPTQAAALAAQAAEFDLQVD